MAEIQFIVDKLNEPPFNKDLRLVRLGLGTDAPCLIILVTFIFVIDEEHTSPLGGKYGGSPKYGISSQISVSMAM